MAMTIFFLLNGLGVVFMLYVLANFWKEGHRPKSDSPRYATESGRHDWTYVLVVTHPISHNAQAGLSVIPFRKRDRFNDKPGHKVTPYGTPEVPARRISTR
jgi:hypothetical protein